MARIVLEKITKTFGRVVAVKELNLEIRDGEFVALLGPSGCGKTTTLLLIAGIYRPTSGNIYFDDVLMNDVAPKDRYVGLVFQSYALYPHMSVYENIAFPLRLNRTPRHEIDRKVREVAELAKIEELLDRKPGQLSGGQQQRVALCRALVKEPEVLLLDEPLSNLDARLRIETRAEIKRLQKELGITTILVTHDQVEALSMADRVAVMHQGVLQQYTTPEELYNHPKNLFVASFIGDPPINLLPVHYRRERKQARLLLPNGQGALAIPEELARRLEAQGITEAEELTLGVRPDDVQLSEEETPEGFPAAVYLAETLGGEVLVHFRLGEIPIRVLVPQGFRVQVGQHFWLVPDPEKLHLFASDGRSLLFEEEPVPQPQKA
jgi:ABC-type sugar transport system ATPase subunit